jgi:site-specific recombinase XerD
MSHRSKGKKFPPEVLTREEVLSLLGACSTRAHTGIRDRALFSTLWRGQLRVSEATALEPHDIDLDACTIHVRHGKGDKARLVVIDRQTVTLIRNWLARRSLLGLDAATRVFCTLKGTPLSRIQVAVTIALRGRKAGLKKRVHPHGLRHTGASELAAEGVPLIEIRDQLGHTSLATTAAYISNLYPGERIKRLSERVW